MDKPRIVAGILKNCKIPQTSGYRKINSLIDVGLLVPNGHSITPDGKIYVSPCVYLHDYKSTYDLLKHDLIEIINSPQFKVFRQRHANPQMIEDCKDCLFLEKCGGGCISRAYLENLHNTGKRSMLTKDPYCPLKIAPNDKFPKRPRIETSECLVHMDYLCTWIGKPK